MRRRVTWMAAALALLTAAAVGAFAAWLPRLGNWLIIQEPLRASDAIVVLGGNLPFRSQEAASLYRQGWASEVWITAPETPAEEEAIKNLGLWSVPRQDLSRRVLEHFGVPAAAIRTLSSEAANTTQEIHLVVDELSTLGLHRAILVTSKAHTRRVRATWNAISRRGQEGVVRHIERDVFNPDQWWTRERDKEIVIHEAGGLLYIWSTHPIRGIAGTF